MGFIFIAIITILSSTAFASTNSIFANDGSKVSIFVMNAPGDNDGSRLFNALTAKPEEINGKLTKKIAFDDETGKHVMSVVCVFSKVITDSGTCTLVIQATPATVVDKGAHVARFILLQPLEAQRMADNFVVPANTELIVPIYNSKDGSLLINAQRNEESNELQTFSMEYR